MTDQQQQKRLRPSGGYRTLRAFCTVTIIYDATVSFCERFIDRHSRIVDQMVQSARSGRQNIAEGSRAAATSSQTELRLKNVARASLDELLLDYEDYLRQNKKRIWTKDDPEAKEVREVGKNLKYDPPDPADPADAQDKKNAAAYAKWLVGADDGTIANALICLIHQTNYLLDQHVKGLERDFVDGGGYSEQLAAARLAKRASETDNKPKEQGKMPHPVCLVCGKPMVLRTARKGPHVGKQFLGCSGYPDCKATLAVA